MPLLLLLLAAAVAAAAAACTDAPVCTVCTCTGAAGALQVACAALPCAARWGDVSGVALVNVALTDAALPVAAFQGLSTAQLYVLDHRNEDQSGVLPGCCGGG